MSDWNYRDDSGNDINPEKRGAFVWRYDQETSVSGVDDAAISIVNEVFREQGWHYSSRSINPDTTLFELSFTINKNNVNMYVFVGSNPEVCRIDAVLPFIVEESYTYPLVKAISEANYSKRYGAFIYDKDSRKIKYRYCFPIGHGLYKDQFLLMFRTVLLSSVDATDYVKIKRIAMGNIKNHEKIGILKDIHNLVEDITDSLM